MKTVTPAMSRSQPAGLGGIPELVQLFPEAADSVDPAEIRKIWSDEKLREFAKSATEDMESGGVRDACALAVEEQEMKIRKLKGFMFGEGYCDEGENSYLNQARRIEDQERNARVYSFDEVKDKAAREPLLAAIAKEEARLAATEAELETAKKLHDEALSAAPPVAAAAASAEEAKAVAEQAKKDATEAVKQAMEAHKITTAARAAAQKAQAAAKPNFTKAADAHKKATENLDAKNAADAALAQAAEALQVADAAFEVAKQAAEATKTAVKDAETKVKETTTAQAEAKKVEAAAKTALVKASAEVKKAKADAVEAAAAAEADATVAVATASEAVVSADAALAHAKQAVIDTKAADKDTDTAFKAATKVQVDAKRVMTQATDVLSKAAAKITQQTGPLDVLAAAAAEAEGAMRQADDDFAAADKADNEARQATVDTKQVEKDADTAFKNATKASLDAKAEERKIAEQVKKSQLSVEAVQRKVQDFSSSMSTLTSSRNKINTLDKNLEAQKAKFDAANQSLAQEKAKMADWEQQIVHCNEEKLRICREARGPEMEEIVRSMQASRDELLHELEDAEAQVAVIAKLRADRIAMFGQAEIDRRVQVQLKILDLKKAENDRSDLLPRICDVCGCDAGNHFQCEKHTCVTKTKDGNFVYVKPTFKTPGANYVSVDAPSLDGHFWGTDWEKKSDSELMNYPFKADIVTNPYSSWWASFHGPYFVNGEKVDRKTDCEDGTPTADEAFAKLPPNLKPLPAMTPIAERFRPILEERHGERIDGDANRRVFIRDRLQHGPISKRGDRFEFMRYHRWYCVTANAAFCRQCGLNPETFGAL
jgi:hypothetical protein